MESPKLLKPDDVVFEDSEVIAVNKPADIRSVPGHDDTMLGKQKEWHAGTKRKRQDMWTEVLNDPGLLETASEHLKAPLEKLREKNNIPRRKSKFISFSRRFLALDDEAIEDLWLVLQTSLKEAVGPPTDSMLTRVQVAHPDAKVLHRLDMETSGILIFALNQRAAGEIAKQFRNGEVKKEYIAVVSGKLEGTEDNGSKGEIDLPLRPDRDNRPRQIVDHVDGKPARTLYSIIHQEEDRTRVRLHPVTGRTHQLRVHLSAIGHPILGDSLYASPEDRVKADRLLLHAEKLKFKKPTSISLDDEKCPLETIELMAECPF